MIRLAEEMGRQRVMLSAFPHWDPRKGHGQRSGAGQWSAVVFLAETDVVHGNEKYHSKPPPTQIAGASGATSVHSGILPQGIEKVVAFVPSLFGQEQEDLVLTGGLVIPGSGVTPRRKA